MFVPSIVAIIFTFLATFTLGNVIESQSFSSDIQCQSSSSSSSSDYCDPCCVGVQKLTYQAPTIAGSYLSNLVQRFTIFDVFGPEACTTIKYKSIALGIPLAVIVGSDGYDICAMAAYQAAKVLEEFATAPADITGTLLDNNQRFRVAAQDYIDSPVPQNQQNVIIRANDLIASATTLQNLAIAAKTTAIDPAAVALAERVYNQADQIIEYAEAAIVVVNTGSPPDELAPIQTSINAAVMNAVGASIDLLALSEKAAFIPYGTFYVVSRAWVLNKPVYAFQNNEMYAANSLYNCEDEYRAIYIHKPVSKIFYGDYCPDQCRSSKKSCLERCASLLRPEYLPKFKIGA